MLRQLVRSRPLAQHSLPRDIGTKHPQKQYCKCNWGLFGKQVLLQHAKLPDVPRVEVWWHNYYWNHHIRNC